MKSVKTADQEAARLLARGGRIFTIAALAWTRGKKPGLQNWRTLDPVTAAYTEEIVEVLRGGVDPSLVDTIVKNVMEEKPATAAPRWAESLADVDGLLERVGQEIEVELLRPALGFGIVEPEKRLKGLAAMAVAMCRSIDGLRAWASRLPTIDEEAAVRMTHLASATVVSGEPTKMRSKLRAVLKHLEHG